MLRAIMTLVVSALVLIVSSWIIPGFTIFGFWGAVKTALVITVLGFGVEKLLGNKMSQKGRGLASFIVGAVVIYLSQYLVPSSVQATAIGALIASLVIGIIDGIIPTSLR